MEKSKGKQATSDILINLNEAAPKKSKKYFSPGEFGIELLDGDLGPSLIDFESARLTCKLDEVTLEKKFDIGGDFLKKKRLNYVQSVYAKEKQKAREKAATTGKRHFDMAAPELTQEVKNDLKLLRYRKVLDDKTFFKNDDRRGHAKHFQVGTIMDSAEDFYSTRLTKKERKTNLVDEILADTNFKRLQKKRQAKMNAIAMANRGNPKRSKKKKT